MRRAAKCFTFSFNTPIIAAIIKLLQFYIACVSFMIRFQNWFHAQSPRGQWVAGCAGIVVVITLCLYGLGLFSYVARLTLVATPLVETVVITLPTVPQRPTFSPSSIPPTLALPGSTLQATPTQAPIPTRAPPTETPLFILDPNGTPITVTPLPSETPVFGLQSQVIATQAP